MWERIIRLFFLLALTVSSQKAEDCKCLKNAHEKYTMATACGGETYKDYMTNVERELRSHCDLVDPTHCKPLSGDEEQEEFDFIVVGSGAAGPVVAGRLAENTKYSVLLLEAGGPAPVGVNVPGMYFQYNGNPDVDWDFELEPQPNACFGQPGGVCRWPRGKGLGGTTLLHGMMYMRGYPEDFDFLKTQGIEGWDWDDVYPFYLRSEDNKEIGTYADKEHHATGGLLPVQRFNYLPELGKNILEAAKELNFPSNIDLNGNVRTGFTQAQATTKDGSRLTTLKAFIYDHLKDDARIQIRPHAFVTRLLIDDTPEKRCYGVVYETNSETKIVRAKREVILSAGAIGSPVILMHSGIGDTEKLSKLGIKPVHHLPGVGKNVKNHLSYSIPFFVKNSTISSLLNNETLKEYLKDRTGPMSCTGLSQLTGFLHTDMNVPEIQPPDLQVFFAGMQGHCTSCKETGTERTKISITPTVLRPKTTGFIELKSRYPKLPPKINTGLLNELYDREIILRGIRIVQKLVNTNALKDILEMDETPAPGCEHLTFDSDDFWRCSIMSLTNPENHQTGSCSMGPKYDKLAVTNSELLVYGIKNLRVIDASILPSVPSGNLLAPVIMVAERGAQFIKDFWEWMP